MRGNALGFGAMKGLCWTLARLPAAGSSVGGHADGGATIESRPAPNKTDFCG